MEFKDYEEEQYMPNSANDEEILIGHKQKTKSIYRVIKDSNAHGTGFLCKFPFGSKNKLLPVLITNNHVIDENYILDVGVIIIKKDNEEAHYLYFNDEKNYRRYYTEKENDITIIEILHSDNLDFDSFLEVDENYNKENQNDIYHNQNAYVIHFPEMNTAILTTGIIEFIEGNEIFHKCSTGKGSSGCPILNSKNNKVIGIHKGFTNDFNSNIGTIIKYAIQKFHEEMVNKGNNYFENYFDGIEYIDIIYKVNEQEKILKIFGEKFVEINKNKCNIIINYIEYGLCSHINVKDYNYDNSGKFRIKLYGVKNITSMCQMFHKCRNLLEVPNISQMNTSKITNMNRLFEGCELLERLPNISNWNIENVTDIRGMFYNCKNLKYISDISNWNTSNVTTMREMFWSCSNLKTSDLPEVAKWDTRKADDAKDIYDGYSYLKSKHVGDFIASKFLKIPQMLNFKFGK